MNLEERLSAFISLGEEINGIDKQSLEPLLVRIENNNSWFREEQSKKALKGIAHYLSKEQLENWLNQYDTGLSKAKHVGIIMAGNIPGVGFHDLLCVLMAGHIAHVKLSSTDIVLIPFLMDLLVSIAPGFRDKVFFDERLSGMDAYIATGSDNSARYFEYYFGKYPHIIRKNRTSVAIIDGLEIKSDWGLLAEDVFQYYGLGCRNVSKIFFPDKAHVGMFLQAMEDYRTKVDHHKYNNNYDYNKSIYLVNKEPHLDNGFLLLKESEELVSPIAVAYYQIYPDLEWLEDNLRLNRDKIQCIVSREGWFSGSIPFGAAQCPGVADYADRVDTMKFLLDLGKYQ
ncbi:acyl-CoA reductase [Negadavirga shengliensis]|uniref:Acyl-CoA reductase n=1 Tax=Negadavirga shengliensis TaxID=1389218 RepID=A0ABV9T3C5_9BACT